MQVGYLVENMNREKNAFKRSSVSEGQLYFLFLYL